jgi:hypothetical protein
MFHRNLVIFFILAGSIYLPAETLQLMAQKSNALLVLSDDLRAQKKCKFEISKISMLSQKLKAIIDQKINRLSASDFKILEKRAENCQTDCTCTIYSLAYEVHNKENQAIENKAKTETTADRVHCASRIKDICHFINY